MKTRVAAAAAFVVTLTFQVRAQIPTPLGPEFVVNSFTTNAQTLPKITVDPAGNFVVVWESAGQDGSGRGVYTQRFLSSGIRNGTEFRVNTYTTLAQARPAVASAANGDFVVDWHSDSQDGSSYGIHAQRMNRGAAPLGGEFLANTFTTNAQDNPAVAMQADGKFIAVWRSIVQDPGGSAGVYGQRYDANGTPRGVEFRVNTYTTSEQNRPAIAIDDAGNVVIAWESVSQDGSSTGIYAQRYDAFDATAGSEFRVNTYTTGNQIQPSLDIDRNGNFVVAWNSDDGFGQGVFAQRFNALGVPQGIEFRVNAETIGFQGDPSVAMEPDTGDFVIAWNGYRSDAAQRGIFVQRYNAAGASTGPEFRVNTTATSYPTYPTVSYDDRGDFVVAWQDQININDIAARRFASYLGFTDNFESGNLTAWSSASTGGSDLSVNAAAGMGGSALGLQAVVNDTGSLFVQDESPIAEDRYRAGFFFDPNGFDPGEASSHFRVRIAVAFSSAATRRAAIVLRRVGGAYGIMGRVRLDGGVQADTGFVPITDAPHHIEFDIQFANGVGANNGRFRMWIDGVLVGTLNALDNDQGNVEFIRLGALSLKGGVAGTMFWDLFEARLPPPVY